MMSESSDDSSFGGSDEGSIDGSDESIDQSSDESGEESSDGGSDEGNDDSSVDGSVDDSDDSASESLGNVSLPDQEIHSNARGRDMNRAVFRRHRERAKAGLGRNKAAQLRGKLALERRKKSRANARHAAQENEMRELRRSREKLQKDLFQLERKCRDMEDELKMLRGGVDEAKRAHELELFRMKARLKSENFERQKELEELRQQTKSEAYIAKMKARAEARATQIDEELSDAQASENGMDFHNIVSMMAQRYLASMQQQPNVPYYSHFQPPSAQPYFGVAAPHILPAQPQFGMPRPQYGPGYPQQPIQHFAVGFAPQGNQLPVQGQQFYQPVQQAQQHQQQPI